VRCAKNDPPTKPRTIRFRVSSKKGAQRQRTRKPDLKAFADSECIDCRPLFPGLHALPALLGSLAYRLLHGAAPELN
jgi:hypothetical protein